MTVAHPFGVAVLADDFDGALATLADDVVFRSPAVHKPYQGKVQVEQVLRLVATVFENFRYVAEWRDGRTTILLFEANVGDRDLQGIVTAMKSNPLWKLTRAGRRGRIFVSTDDSLLQADTDVGATIRTIRRQFLANG